MPQHLGADHGRACLLGQGEHIPLVMKAGRTQVDRLNP
jgi:hypothetical protein